MNPTNLLNNRIRALALTASLAFAGLAQTIHAGPIPYPTPGTPNPVTYTFTATATGNLIGYFAGSTAAYDEQVGLFDNGVLTPAGYGLDDHSSAIGQTFDFGLVTAGDTLTFADKIEPNGNGVVSGYVYSNPAWNLAYDGAVSNHNHVYSTNATAGQVSVSIPAGTYVAFEDLPFPYSDYNYFDDTFVFTNVSTTVNGAPDGASTIALLGLGLAGLGMLRRRLVAV